MLVFAGGSCIAAQADHHIFLKANLILGTNTEQKDKMEALPAIKDKLSSVFKWEYYYRLNRKKIELAIIVGENEFNENKLVIKKLTSSKENDQIIINRNSATYVLLIIYGRQ